MYGLVNKAIEGLVVENHGEEAWESIKQKAGIEVDLFVSNESYDDAVTYNLVGAACDVLTAPADAILESFGPYWITKIATESYGHMMDAGGNSLTEFMQNLPNFHTRVSMIFPNLRPPRFEVTDIEPNRLRLHYHSHRPGLQAFVVGLMKGLGARFGDDVDVKLLETKSEDPVHQIFDVSW